MICSVIRDKCRLRKAVDQARKVHLYVSVRIYSGKRFSPAWLTTYEGQRLSLIEAWSPVVVLRLDNLVKTSFWVMQATMCMLRGGDSSFALLPSATGQRRRVRRRNGFSAVVTGQKRLFFPWAGASAMQPALAHRMILHTATSRELPVVDCCDKFDRGDSWVMMHLLFFSSFFFQTLASYSPLESQSSNWSDHRGRRPQGSARQKISHISVSNFCEFK